MTTTNDTLIAAVGGQGALLAARIFGRFACEQGLDVKVSEIHGMSQRGGSVVTHVRSGPGVHSPVIEAGTADVLLAFELLEAARYLDMLKPGGTLVVNTQRILPLPVLTGAARYPEDLVERFKGLPIDVIAIDALSEAQSLGNPKTVNTILIGTYAKYSATDLTLWRRAITATVRESHLAANLAAFERGLTLVPERLRDDLSSPEKGTSA